MHIDLYKARKYAEDNLRYLNMISYYLSKREYTTVKQMITNVNKFTKDETMSSRVNNLFFMDKRAQEYFGIAEDIVGSMTNMVFGGDVTIKTQQKNAERFIDKIYTDGSYLNSIIDTYKTSIATNGKAYLFYKFITLYNTKTQKVNGYEFIGYDVVPEFELKVRRNKVTRTFVEERFNNVKKENEYYKFEYNYRKINDKKYTLEIEGYDQENNALSSTDVMDILKINATYEEYDFKPYDVLELDEGMLPNILWIENSLAENLYFQDIDLVNSQTTIYMPEDQLLEVSISGQRTDTFNDKYNTTKIVKGGSIDKRENIASVVEGKSSISFIERNLALNVIQACLDAKISPISIGYSLVEKMINNTDVGSDKERVSIRLRESHIDKLKIFMAKVLQKELMFYGINIGLEKISIIFAQYITPSIESLTNTLAKQVQFGLKSREQAVLDLSRGELTEEEVKLEISRILLATTQQDYNSNVLSNNEKGIDNVLEGEQVVE